MHSGLRELSQPPDALFTLAPALDGAVWGGRSEENLVQAASLTFPGSGVLHPSSSRPLLTLNLAGSAKPSALTRHWIPCALGACASWYLARTVLRLQRPLLQLAQNVRATTYAFFKDWVYQPLLDMYRVIRHDESSMRMVNAASLRSDVESLARMVASLARDQGRTVAEIADLQHRCLDGDMRFVLEHYESEMSSPLRNALLGDFIRTILIQVQKAKVDTGLALSSLDKLMKSNELNFAFLAVIPTLAVCGGLGWWVRSAFSRTPAWRLRSITHIRGNLRWVGVLSWLA
jgi:nuclear-control-of-ATPase protein 2